MPVYEYRCTACSNEFEYEHRMSEKKTTCEQCGGELERLISRTSFAFKGGGWYKDLYASTKPAADGGGDKAAASGDKAASADKGGGDKGSGDKGSGDKGGGDKGGGDKGGGAAGGGDGGGSSSAGSSTPPAAPSSGTGAAGSAKVAASS